MKGDGMDWEKRSGAECSGVQKREKGTLIRSVNQ